SYLDSPNSRVNWYGRLLHDQTNQVKFQGTYVVPKVGLTFSGNYTFFSGDTWTPRERCLLVGGSCYNFSQGTVRYFSAPPGSRRLPSASTLDLRAEWFHDFRGSGRLGIFADAFNLNNQGRPTEVQARVGSTEGEPLTFNLPRNIRFGARYNF